MRVNKTAFITGLTLGSIGLGALTLSVGAFAAEGSGTVPVSAIDQTATAQIQPETTHAPPANPAPTDEAVADAAGTALEPVSTAVTDAAASDAAGPIAPPVAGDPANASVAAESDAQPAVDPMSPEYNPYLEPTDPRYVTDAEKKTWFALQDVIRQCMADQGLEYLDWEWWVDDSPEPKGLEYEAHVAWLKGLYGDDYLNPSSDWEESGCSGYGLHVTGDTVH